MRDKAEEFKAELLAILEKYEVGIQGSMMFVVGEERLMLSTEKNAPTEDSPEGCPSGCGSGCGGEDESTG